MTDPAPRIDTLRNQLQATQQLLATIAEELDDLHVLAYERHTARQDAMATTTNGGTRDYALDTHGNPQARHAYRALAQATAHAARHLTTHTHEAIRILRTHDDHRPKTPRIIKAEELAEAIDAQARRIQRGDYVPIRREPQPDRERTIRSLRADINTLRQPWTSPELVQVLAERLTIRETQARDLLHWLIDTMTTTQQTKPKRNGWRKSR